MLISPEISPRASLWSDGRLSCCFHITAAIDIIESHDVVFTQVGAALHFDQFHRDASGIGETVFAAQGDVGALVLSHQLGLSIPFDHGGSIDDNPVFRPVVMHLQRQAGTRFD